MQFRRQLNRNGPMISKLPHRLSLIGIPALPPFHMEILTAIAGYTEINLFFLILAGNTGVNCLREGARPERAAGIRLQRRDRLF